MHGRPRTSVREEEATQSDAQHREAVQKKVRLYNRLKDEVLKHHLQKNFTPETLQLSAKLLELNPDFYTVWNFRKSAVQHFVAQKPEAEARKALFQEELLVTERALKKNYKAYGPWYHRKWVLSFGESSLKREFELLDKFLKADSRNFHGWDHRRFVLEKSKTSFSNALEFTTQKINENFSNYSAWHARSHLLPKVECEKCRDSNSSPSSNISLSVLKQEFELVRQAFFTEPDDQSGWMYYTWLLKKTFPISVPLSLSYSFPLPGTSLSFPFTAGNDFSIILGFHVPMKLTKEDSISVALEGVKYKEKPGNESKRVENGNKNVDENAEEWERSHVTTLNSMPWKPLTPIESLSTIWMKDIKFEDENGAAGYSDLDKLVVRIKVDSQESIQSASGQILTQPFNIQFCLVNNAPISTSHPSTLRPKDSSSEIQGRDQGNEAVGRYPLWPSFESPNSSQDQIKNAELDRNKVIDLMKLECGLSEVGEILDLSNRDEARLEELENDVKNQRSDILDTEISMCHDLLELEPDSKWALLTLTRLLECKTSIIAPKARTQLYDEMVQIYERLIVLDKYHENYFESLIGKTNLKKVLENEESFLSKFHTLPPTCFRSSQISNSDLLWLRLNSLKICRFDSNFQNNLFWIKRLDLSHNRLRSACGLEVLQCLEWLDLSNNQIRHSLALKSLSLLPKLRALNLANNFIGGSIIQKNDHLNQPSNHSHSHSHHSRLFTQRYISPIVNDATKIPTESKDQENCHRNHPPSINSSNVLSLRFSKILNLSKDLNSEGVSTSTNTSTEDRFSEDAWDILEGFRHLYALTILDLRGNQVEKHDRCISALRELLPNLQFLNGHLP